MKEAIISALESLEKAFHNTFNVLLVEAEKENFDIIFDLLNKAKMLIEEYTEYIEELLDLNEKIQERIKSWEKKNTNKTIPLKQPKVEWFHEKIDKEKEIGGKK